MQIGGGKMIKDKIIKIEINSKNRKKYEKILNKKLEDVQYIDINQNDVLPTSRIEVECVCDNCGISFFRKKVSIKSESGITLCSKACRNNFFSNLYKTSLNPNPRKDKIGVKCNICNKIMFVNESKYKKQKYFLCSRECYKKHRSIKYKGDKLYNYQMIFVNCAICNKKLKTTEWELKRNKHIFCSSECYWEHRRRYYKEYYYDDSLNYSRKETYPESLVREWLENNNIKFKQECGFLKKYYVDFYLPDYKIIIEVYGDYWHVNPRIYDIHGNDKNKKPLTDIQKEKIKTNYDNIRKKELESYGYKVKILWEYDILRDLNSLMVDILKKYK